MPNHYDESGPGGIASAQGDEPTGIRGAYAPVSMIVSDDADGEGASEGESEIAEPGHDDSPDNGESSDDEEGELVMAVDDDVAGRGLFDLQEAIGPSQQDEFGTVLPNFSGVSDGKKPATASVSTFLEVDDDSGWDEEVEVACSDARAPMEQACAGTPEILYASDGCERPTYEALLKPGSDPYPILSGYLAAIKTEFEGYDQLYFNRLEQLVDEGDRFPYNKGYAHQVFVVIEMYRAIAREGAEDRTVKKILEWATGLGKTNVMWLFLMVGLSPSIMRQGGGRASCASSVRERWQDRSRAQAPYQPRGNSVAIIVVPQIKLGTQATDRYAEIKDTYCKYMKWGSMPICFYSKLNKKKIPSDTKILVVCDKTFSKMKSDADHMAVVWLKDRDLMTVVFDEAHATLQPDYLPFLQDELRPASMLAVSATASYPCGGHTLTDFMKSKADELTLLPFNVKDGVKLGKLSPLCLMKCYMPLSTKPIIHSVNRHAGDYNRLQFLGEKLCKPECHRAIAHMLLHGKDQTGRLFKHLTTLVHCVSIRQADQLSELLNGCFGRDFSVSVNSKTPKLPEAFGRFKSGQVQCLLGVDMTRMGFDKKDVSLVIVARPTMLEGLSIQMAGRGTRLAKGKPHCTVVVVDYGVKGGCDLASVLDADDDWTMGGSKYHIEMPPAVDFGGLALRSYAERASRLEGCSAHQPYVLYDGPPRDIDLVLARLNAGVHTVASKTSSADGSEAKNKAMVASLAVLCESLELMMDKFKTINSNVESSGVQLFDPSTHSDQHGGAAEEGPSTSSTSPNEDEGADSDLDDNLGEDITDSSDHSVMTEPDDDGMDTHDDGALADSMDISVDGGAPASAGEVSMAQSETILKMVAKAERSVKQFEDYLDDVKHSHLSDEVVPRGCGGEPKAKRSRVQSSEENEVVGFRVRLQKLLVRGKQLVTSFKPHDLAGVSASGSASLGSDVAEGVQQNFIDLIESTVALVAMYRDHEAVFKQIFQMPVHLQAAIQNRDLDRLLSLVNAMDGNDELLQAVLHDSNLASIRSGLVTWLNICLQSTDVGNIETVRKVAKFLDKLSASRSEAECQFTNSALALSGHLGQMWAVFDVCLIERLKVLYDLGADVNASRSDGHTVLYDALAHCRNALCAFLISELKSLDLSHRFNCTYVADSSYENNIRTDESYLMFACRNNVSSKVISCLVDHPKKYFDINEISKSLITASFCKQIEAMNVLCGVRDVSINGSFAGVWHDATALHVAAYKGHTEAVELLIKSKADIHVINVHTGWAPLHSAVCKGYVGVVRALLDAGADATCTVRKGRHANKTALDIAKLQGHHEICGLLRREVGAPSASQRGDLDLEGLPNIDELGEGIFLPEDALTLSENAQSLALPDDPVGLMSANTSDREGPLVLEGGRDQAEVADRLFIASVLGDTATVKSMLEQKIVNVDMRDANKRTPLMYAVRLMWPELVLMLLEKGADANARCMKGMSPLLWIFAPRHGSGSDQYYSFESEFVERCKRYRTQYASWPFGMNFDEHGASVKSSIYRKRLKKNCVNMINMLLASRCDIHAVNPDDGRDALSYAAGGKVRISKGDCEVLGVLLRHQANVNRCDANGHTPLFYAASKGGQHRVLQLLSCHADPGKECKYGKTLLMYKMVCGWDVCRVLIEEGKIDVNAVDKEGMNALMLHSGSHQDSRTEIVSNLIPRTRNINVRCRAAHYTALMYLARASSKKNDSVVLARAMVEAGADVTLMSYDGDTALSLAKRKKDNHDAKLIVYLNKCMADAKAQSLHVSGSGSQHPVHRSNEIDHGVGGGGAAVAVVHHASMFGGQSVEPNDARPAALEPQSNELLLDAVKQRSVRGVQDALAKNANVNARDPSGLTVLHVLYLGYSVKWPRAEYHQDLDQIALILLERPGRHINARDHLGRTVLSRAVAVSSLPVVNHLLKSGHNPSAKDSCGISVLYYAIKGGSLEVVAALLGYLKKDVSFPGEHLGTNDPISVAVQSTYDHTDQMIALLVKSGLQINDNAICEAVHSNSMKTLMALVSNGAKVSVRCAANRKDLLMITGCHSVEIITFLCKQIGRDDFMDSKDPSGRTALMCHAAATVDRKNYVQIIKTLLDKVMTLSESDKDTYLNHQDVTGNTALMCVVGASNRNVGWHAQRMKIVEALIEAGAKVGMFNMKGQTAIDIARTIKRHGEALADYLNKCREQENAVQGRSGGSFRPVVRNSLFSGGSAEGGPSSALPDQADVSSVFGNLAP